MPSEKVLSEKKAIVAALAEKIKASGTGVLVDYKGLTVAEDTELRKALRAAGVEYAVVKNTLTRFALKEAGYEGLDEVLNGTTSLALAGDDVVAPAKVICKFAKDHGDRTLSRFPKFPRRKTLSPKRSTASFLLFRVLRSRSKQSPTRRTKAQRHPLRRLPQNKREYIAA